MFVYFAEESARLLTGKKIYSIFQEPCQEVAEFIGSYGIFTEAGRFWAEENPRPIFFRGKIAKKDLGQPR